MVEQVNKTIHLDEAELNSNNPLCVICGCSVRAKAGNLQESPTIELLRCSLCGIVSALRMPLEKTLADFYGQYYNQSFYKDRGEVVAVLSPGHLARHIYGCLGPKMKKSEMHILDFGGGDGTVALLLGKQFLADGYTERVHITTIDYNIDNLHQESSGAITVQKRNALNPDSSETYDVILASAVLEHLTNPREILENLLIRMSPGGLFYARTPYIVPFRQFLTLLGITFDFTYPAHLHDMGALFWNRILTTLNLQGHYSLLKSQPSFVETPFAVSFFRALASHMLKAPWYVLGNAWPLVGGWEVIIGSRILKGSELKN